MFRQLAAYNRWADACLYEAALTPVLIGLRLLPRRQTDPNSRLASGAVGLSRNFCIAVTLGGIAVLAPFDAERAFRYGATDIQRAAEMAKVLASPDQPATSLLRPQLLRATEICNRMRHQIDARAARLAVTSRSGSEEIHAMLGADDPGALDQSCRPERSWRPATFAAIRIRLWCLRPPAARI
jgi:hypothetical protein